MEVTADWIFALAVVYTVLTSIPMLAGYYLALTALSNLNVICFRSLGRPYITSLLVTCGTLHLLGIAAVWHATYQHDVNVVIVVNGTLTGLRVATSGVLYSIICARQYMLAKIFGTLKKNAVFGRYQSFWPPVFLATVIWIPILILFYVVLFLYIDISYFCSPLFVYYFVYTLGFIYLGYRNRTINKLFSDYNRNLATGVVLIIVLFVSIWITFQYQVVTMETYVFEIAISFSFGCQAVVALLVTLVSPFVMWKTNPEMVKSWDEFNKKNANMFDASSSRKSDVGLESALAIAVAELEAVRVTHVDEVDRKSALDEPVVEEE